MIISWATLIQMFSVAISMFYGLAKTKGYNNQPTPVGQIGGVMPRDRPWLG